MCNTKDRVLICMQPTFHAADAKMKAAEWTPLLPLSALLDLTRSEQRASRSSFRSRGLQPITRIYSISIIAETT